MAARYQYVELAEAINGRLPAPDDMPVRDSEFWNRLGVNAPRVLVQAADPQVAAKAVSSLGVGGLRVLCLWLGVPPEQAKPDLITSLAQTLSARPNAPGHQSILLLSEFVGRKREDAFGSASHLLLGEESYGLVQSSGIDQNSRRLLYALLAYADDPGKVQVLMLFESAEKAGYTRYMLAPMVEDAAGQPLADDVVEEAKHLIEEGADLDEIDAEWMDHALESFEQRHGHLRSCCYDLHRENGTVVVYVFRFLREAQIRETDSVVFADEAELIVLRLYDRIRLIDVHSTSSVGAQVAAMMASILLDVDNVRYLKDEELTMDESMNALVAALRGADDDRLRLRELYLRSAPLPEEPSLVLRSDGSESLAAPLHHLAQQGIDLLHDLEDVRSFKVAFVVPVAPGRERAYSFTVHMERVRVGRWFSPYSVANIPTHIRSDFESYVKETYGVQVVPGAPERHR